MPDIPQLLECLKKQDNHVLIIDESLDSRLIVGNLVTQNPELMVIYLAESQQPTPPPEGKIITHTLQRPLTVQSLKNLLCTYRI